MRVRGFFFVIVSSISWSAHAAETLSLDGEWRFKLDPDGIGIAQKWYEQDLPDRIELPGTTDLAGKGYRLRTESMDYGVPILDSDWPGRSPAERIDESGHLVREWFYIGKAWYQRVLNIPTSWSGKHIRLRLERVIWGTTVWLDNRPVGSCDSLVTEHQFDLGFVSPGTHSLTICVDNDLQHNIGIIGHAYGPETQSRWNGIVGDIELVATDPLFIDGLKVYPAPDCRSVLVDVSLRNLTARRSQARLELSVRSEDGRTRMGSETAWLWVEPGLQDIERVISIERDVQRWDEFNPVLYVVTVEVKTGRLHDSKTDRFGFRHLERDGRHLRLNDRRIFLRGVLDCCVYPKTGHPPMSVDEWLGVLGTIKEYGFNHVRFHTWCPPRAAFEAADRLGLYLAPETPFWVDDWVCNTSSKPKLIGQDREVLEYVRREIRRISDCYGNHPSFAFFCLGNEFGMSSDWELIDELLVEAKHYDSRRLYTATTARRRVPHDDYWVTHRVPGPDGGSLRTRGVGPAHTDWDFSAAVAAVDLPLVAHETGQRPVFPDYEKLLPKFTGPLKPYNLERLQRELVRAGLADQVGDFERASGWFQYLQYKAEHEGFLRTPHLAGYQLLMLNDFTGQSEALVGILDPFWEPKGVISAALVRQWNAPTVLLARLPRYTWTETENFHCRAEVAHYGPRAIRNGVVRWSLVDAFGSSIARGAFSGVFIPRGGVTHLGEINVALDGVDAPAVLTLRLELADTAANEWRVWVYSPAGRERIPADVLVTDDLGRALEALRQGGRVLLLAHGVKSKYAARTGFLSVYWSAGWWGNEFSALGILCDPRHPAWAGFPNSGHSDWQWFELTQNATTFHLPDAPPGFRPLVQPVTDFHYNRLLAQVFEARVGRGRLLVCGYDLTANLATRHAARQFRRSLLSYVSSEAFRPRHELKPAYLRMLFGME